MGCTLYITFRHLLRLESSFRSRSKGGRGSGYCGESVLSCMATASGEDIHVFSGNEGLISLDQCEAANTRSGEAVTIGGGESAYTGIREDTSIVDGLAAFTGKAGSSEYRGLMSQTSSWSSYMFPSQLIRSFFFPNKCLHFNSRHPSRMGV